MAQLTKLQMRSAMLTERLTKQLESQDAAERTQAAASLTAIHVAETDADSRNRASENDAQGRQDKIGPLRLEIKTLQKAVKTHDEALKKVETQRYGAQLLNDFAMPKVERLKAVDQELQSMRQTYADEKAAIIEAVTHESRQQLRAAEQKEADVKARQAALDKEYSKAGLQEMIEAIKACGVGDGNFWSAAAPRAAQYWALIHNWDIVRASVWCTQAKSWRDDCDGEGFRSRAVAILDQKSTRYSEDDTPQVIPNLDLLCEFYKARAQKFGAACWADIEKRVYALHDVRRAEWKRKSVEQLDQQMENAARAGMGRTPIAFAPVVQESSVPRSEHLLGCGCIACGGAGMREVPSDYIPATPESREFLRAEANVDFDDPNIPVELTPALEAAQKENK